MCTLVVAVQHFTGYPLVVAANRDERLDRPSEGPALRSLGTRSIVAPSDAAAGGTWLGLNDRGLFVGITNRFVPGPRPGAPDPTRRSRGLLVHDALRADTASAATNDIASMDGTRHNPFHLLLADRHSSHLVWSDGLVMRRRRLRPGVHILTERSLSAADSGREQALADTTWSLDTLRDCLTVHRTEPIDSTCVHLPEMNYGTRSATLLWLAEGGPSSFSYTEGPPCSSPWIDGSALLEELWGKGATRSPRGTEPGRPPQPQ